MLKCYIEGKNLINNNPEEFAIAEGAVFTENFNETLDSGTIILPHLDHEIDIDSYDVVVITDDTGKRKQRRLCVDRFICTETNLDEPIYNYEITLFSETKGLEGILLPSLSITKLFGNIRKIWFYLDEYITRYNIFLNSDNKGPTSLKYSFGHNIFDENDTVFSRFGAIDCPEMQWNEPTLREVINDLMMVDDCIPVVQNNVINFMDISQTGTEITNTQKKSINRITKTQSSEDYVSELKMNLKNCANNEEPSGDYDSSFDENLPPEVTRITELIGFRNNSEYIIKTDNIRVETSHPIWRLLYMALVLNIHGYVRFLDAEGNRIPDPDNPGRYIPDELETFECDFILKDSSENFVLEYGEWQTKPVLYDPFNVSTELNNQYQNTCLYYTRNSNLIQNFNNLLKIQNLWTDRQYSVYELMLGNRNEDASTKQKWINAFLKQAEEKYPGYPQYQFVGVSAQWSDALENSGSFKNARFRVVYQSLDEFTFFASKTPFSANTRQVIDNQINSYIDANRIGILEYLKAKRLGNKLYLVNGRYLGNESEMPDLSQMVNGKIIFSKQITCYNDYTDVNYQAIENYVLQDYFTSIKSKLRSWRILSGNEAFIRADNIKFYFNENLSTIYNQYVRIPVYETLDDYISHFKYCAIRFTLGDNSSLPNHSNYLYKGVDYGINTYLIEFSKRKCGNSVLFTIKMQDNAILGRYISNRDGTGGMEQKNCKYVDDNGENIGGAIWFFETLNPIVPLTESLGDSKYAVSSALKPGIAWSQITTVVAYIPFEFKKDNKEITQITIQFEYNEEANDVFIGKNNNI